jgi:hypothetical protein
MILFGLRASEPCLLFRENLDVDWLRVPCIPDLAYQTKGRRDKRFPLMESLQRFWNALREGMQHGLLYRRRAVVEGRETPLLKDLSLPDIIAEFQKRLAGSKGVHAAGRLRLRDAVLHEAGGLKYDHVEAEFHAVAGRLHWPAHATLKDFRHLFCTTLGNTSMPEGYRRYLMGHAPGKAAVVAYTHLNKLREHFEKAVEIDFRPLVDALTSRLGELKWKD